MRFWDSSAVVPLLIDQRATAAVQSEYERDPEILVWWATAVETHSALARIEREGLIERSSLTESLRRLDGFIQSWREVDATARVRQAAIRLLRVHPLRAADALQLGAAVVAGEDHPETLPFVTLDDRLSEAAEREGFSVVRPALG